MTDGITILSATREVKDAIKNLAQAHTESEYLSEGVSTSPRSTELSMLQYKEGLIDYQRALDSIRTLRTKQDQYAQNKGKIATNTIALYKAFGGGWQIDHQNEILLPPKMIQEMEERTDGGSQITPEEE